MLRDAQSVVLACIHVLAHLVLQNRKAGLVGRCQQEIVEVLIFDCFARDPALHQRIDFLRDGCRVACQTGSGKTYVDAG